MTKTNWLAAAGIDLSLSEQHDMLNAGLLAHHASRHRDAEAIRVRQGYSDDDLKDDVEKVSRVAA